MINAYVYIVHCDTTSSIKLCKYCRCNDLTTNEKFCHFQNSNNCLANKINRIFGKKNLNSTVNNHMGFKVIH